jgi:IS30 family transposase
MKNSKYETTATHFLMRRGIGENSRDDIRNLFLEAVDLLDGTDESVEKAKDYIENETRAYFIYAADAYEFLNYNSIMSIQEATDLGLH